MAITQKQENWCRHYVEHGNKSEAYRFAYDAKNMKPEVINVKACELSKNGNIVVRVQELRDDLFSELNINVYTIAKDFKEIKERCMQAEPVKDQHGQDTGEWKYDANNAIKATTELGKITGAYEKDNVQKFESTIDLSNLSDEELVQYMKLISKAKSGN